VRRVALLVLAVAAPLGGQSGPGGGGGGSVRARLALWDAYSDEGEYQQALTAVSAVAPNAMWPPSTSLTIWPAPR